MSRLLAAAAVAVLAGCVPGGSATPTPGALTPSLKLGFLGQTNTLDPALSSRPINTYIFPLYDRLTMPDSDGAKPMRPMLATSWSFSADGKSLTMKLREDAYFHDGSQVNADVVRENMVRYKTLPQSTAAGYLKEVSSVEAVNSNTVRFNLSGGGADLLSLFGTVIGAIVNPKTFGADLAHNPPAAAGSGPYVIAPGGTFPSDIRYMRPTSGPPNWDKNAGRVKELQIVQVLPAAGINGVRAGQLDVALLTADSIPAGRSFEALGQYKGHYVSINAVLELLLNPHKPPLDNLTVRQAVAHAINRQAIADDLFKGNCIATHQTVAVSDWTYDKNFKDPYPYDPAKAKALLAQAGFPNGVSTTISYRPTSIFPSVTQVYQAQLAAANINATLDSITPSLSIPRLNAHEYALFSYVNAGGGDPSLIFQWNYGDLLSLAKGTPEESQVMALGQAALDPTLTREKRAALYGQAWAIAATQAWAVAICAQGELWIYNKKVTNIAGAPWMFAGEVDPRYFA